MQSFLFYHLQLAAWNNVHVNIYIYDITVHIKKTPLRYHVLYKTGKSLLA